MLVAIAFGCHLGWTDSNKVTDKPWSQTTTQLITSDVFQCAARYVLAFYVVAKHRWTIAIMLDVLTLINSVSRSRLAVFGGVRRTASLVRNTGTLGGAPRTTFQVLCPDYHSSCGGSPSPILRFRVCGIYLSATKRVSPFWLDVQFIFSCTQPRH